MWVRMCVIELFSENLKRVRYILQYCKYKRNVSKTGQYGNYFLIFPQSYGLMCNHENYDIAYYAVL